MGRRREPWQAIDELRVEADFVDHVSAGLDHGGVGFGGEFAGYADRCSAFGSAVDVTV